MTVGRTITGRVRAILLCAALAAGFTLAGAAQAQSGGAADAPLPPLVPAAEFLAANAKQPGVKALPSGVQVKVLTAGDPGGDSPALGDLMELEYEGRLTNGKVFDSTHGKSTNLQLLGLVKAWMEVLPTMRPGDEWMIYAPPAMGYGEAGHEGVPPGAALVFRVKLLGFMQGE